MKYKCEKCQSEFGNSYNFQRHTNSCDGKGKRANRPKIGRSEAIKQKWKDPEYAKKIADSRLGKKFPLKDRESYVEKRKAEMNLRYANGWQSTCGRAKKYDYESPIAGKIKVDGTWELKVASYLDKIGVKWSRNEKRFSYLTPSGKSSTYCPDFYISDWEAYLEVKGYETDLDKAKWSQFTEKLIVWKKVDLYTLKILED